MLVLAGLDGLQRELYAVELHDDTTPYTKGKVLGGTRLFSHATNRKMVLIFPPKKGKKRLGIRYFSD